MIFIDSAILNLTEQACRWFQRMTGRTNVWLAFQLTNLSIVVYFVWAGMQLLRSRGPYRIVLAMFCGGLLYLLTQTLFKVSVETYENSAYQRVAKGFRNPRRVRDALLRIPFLTLSVLLFYPVALVYFYFPYRLVVVLTYVLIVLTTMVLYLLACDPLPPCPGKLREWIRGAIPARLLAASEPSRGE